ncbi:hypothetical protein BCR35DRAFT_305349 [Leucosporidium creatinivorum]|uniref:Uncharacterized protein n=1 Tax=Leucosporidium creatinivorum TaxID=106004 RepID=A0A1Y2F2M4_9BASI|nr:hypothetical protein BCR35DRAFT_305349 [Leucosporidium creatinivorum]
MPHQAYGTRPEAEGQRPFATPFDQIDTEEFSGEVPDHLEAPYSLQDIDMQKLSYAIRSKPDWHLKRKDLEIRAKWKAEALAQNQGDGGLTEAMVDYTLDELELHERDLNDPNGIRKSCFDKIFESDSLIPSELRDALLQHVAKLENVPEEALDWHPGSNKQVLDLVHPSLFPLRYGISPIRTRNEAGELTEELSAAPEARNAKHSTSKHFQWLPTDFTIAEDGSVKLESYINNLHPEREAAFYPILARLFERFVPMYERVLSDLQSPPPRRINVTSEDAYGWYGEEFDDEAYEGSDIDTAWEEFNEKRQITLPAPKEPFSLPPAPETDAPAFKLRGRTVQVIVKLANILLSPEQPTYEGGVWHVEGMQNEEIVASGIYYYDEENISESRLAFRGTFDEELLSYDQNDNRGVGLVYGIENEGPCVQNFGSLETKGGRAISFPNLYQHQVSNFSLLDPTKPGHRKILVFFLVDPLKRIPSTTDVPPQQQEWAAEELWKDRQEDSTLPSLPNELWAKVLEESPLLSLKEAKVIREELMKERKFLVSENTTAIFERPFSLCEH